MNWNVHILRLMQINAKLKRGEDLSEREIVYVNLLFERMMRIIRPMVREFERALGTDIQRISAVVNSADVKARSEERQRRVMAEQEAAHRAIVQMHQRRRA